MSARRWHELSQEERDSINQRSREQGLAVIPDPFALVKKRSVRFATDGKHFFPVGECLACGHVMQLVVWKEAPLAEVTHGLCASCRDAALPLRGHCSAERGCLCDGRTREEGAADGR